MNLIVCTLLFCLCRIKVHIKSEFCLFVGNETEMKTRQPTPRKRMHYNQPVVKTRESQKES